MDSFYSYPAEQVERVRGEKAWMKDPKYFKRVNLSPSATIKMLTHGQQGVEKGISKAGKPIEVMGLLMGRPGVDDPHSLIITDAFPLPIEGNIAWSLSYFLASALNEKPMLLLFLQYELILLFHHTILA
ncbi:hypothetical protein EON63_17050 [archaeon]|nr:MAG: hypothetical protein EON63_17050 [archaeon]